MEKSVKQIPNFIGRSPLDVDSGINETCGPLVWINQNGGSMYFHHAMTPAQAMELADALIEAAASVMTPVIFPTIAEVEHAG